MFNIIENCLTPEVYCDIRKKVGFIYYDPEDVKIALKNTLYSVEVRDGDKTVGISRVVGDGRVVFFIKDVVVDPEYQCKSIGNTLVNYLLKYIHQNSCENAYIGLMATSGTEKFYERFGFIRRPNDKFGHGMVMFVNKEKDFLC